LELERHSSISISQKEGIFNICLKDVKYFESNGRYVYIHGVDETRKIIYKLDDLAKVLFPNFLRCHKSFSVNMDHIKEVSREGILLFSRDMIPVSRSKYAVVRAEFLNYLGDML
jgi:DNA-binding LytR/AlgR family response regulator